MTPDKTNVRSRVHEYGGGATTLAGDRLYFIDFASQQVHSMPLDGGSASTAVTVDDAGWYWYADGIYDASRKAFVCVREDHGPANPRDVVNEIFGC